MKNSNRFQCFQLRDIGPAAERQRKGEIILMQCDDGKFDYMWVGGARGYLGHMTPRSAVELAKNILRLADADK